VIAWIAFALISAWWATVVLVVVAAVRAARDPKTMAKILARMMPKPPTRAQKPVTTEPLVTVGKRD